MSNKKYMIKKIKDNYDKLTDTQKKICSYLLEHYETVAFMSAVELADIMNVSDVTIIRFVRNLGFSGYVEFKKYLRDGFKGEGLVEDSQTPYGRVNNMLLASGKTVEDCQAIYQYDIKNLQEFMRSFSMDTLTTIVDEIYRARIIYLYGVGTSVAISDFLLTHLRRLGFNVIFVCEGGVDNNEKLLAITKQDILITICFPNYAESSYLAVLYAKRKGIKCILLTDKNSSLISIHSDIVVTLPVKNITYFNSYIVPLEFCNILIMFIFEYDKKNNAAKLKENIGELCNFGNRL